MERGPEVVIPLATLDDLCDLAVYRVIDVAVGNGRTVGARLSAEDHTRDHARLVEVLRQTSDRLVRLADHMETR